MTRLYEFNLSWKDHYDNLAIYCLLWQESMNNMNLKYHIPDIR